MSSWVSKKIKRSNEHQSTASQKINNLVVQSRSGKKITLLSGKELTEFVSCSYLGLDQDKRVIAATQESLEVTGVTFSAARTRVIPESFLTLESMLNEIFCFGYSTFFSSLHMTHLGVIPLLGAGELPSFPIRRFGARFIVDRHSHSSIQINRALMQQFGDIELLDLCDLDKLHHACKKATFEKKTPIIISDSIGSMGCVYPVRNFFLVAEKYDGYVYLDDAHGTSVFGENGCGYVLYELEEKFNRRLLLTASLAKAFGSIAGAVVVPTEEDLLVIKRYSSSYAFGGPPAISVVNSAIASAKIHLSDELFPLQKKLQHNLVYFDNASSKIPYPVVNHGSVSPIRGFRVGDETECIHLSGFLQNYGFLVTAAMYPTVEIKKSIIRVAISAKHSKADIANLVLAIANFIRAKG